MKNIFLDALAVFKSFLKVVLCSLFMIINKDENRKKKFLMEKNNFIGDFFFNNLFKKNHFQERYHQDVYKRFPKRLKKE